MIPRARYRVPAWESCERTPPCRSLRAWPACPDPRGGAVRPCRPISRAARAFTRLLPPVTPCSPAGARFDTRFPHNGPHGWPGWYAATRRHWTEGRTGQMSLLLIVALVGVLSALGPARAAAEEMCPMTPTVAALQECVNHAAGEGLINDAGVATSLLAKISAAQ